mmetsp:Transcript_41056/g.102756  ORF Transcript_41056/g.102756 Transcript_41056/m.102756 type:complete len:89 (+) Transcript_41056:48-314(+)
MFALLTWTSAEDEVASTGSHTISAATSQDFCKLCLHISSSFATGGCRSEYFTDANLKKCGIPVGGSSSGGGQAKGASSKKGSEAPAAK